MTLAVALLVGTVGPLAAVGHAGASPAGRAGVRATVPVSIVEFMFTPKNVQVHVGDTVTWTNNGAVTHTTTAKGGTWDSGNLAPGAMFSFTFNNTGTFLYRCNIHHSMKGGIRVVP
jgi:plastocyanin